MILESKVISSELTTYSFISWKAIPEEINAIYPDLSLEKIYATITYYLQNLQKIDAYLLRLQNWQENRYQEALKHPSPQRKKMRRIKQQRQDSVRV
jgi:hypothetical protein